MGCSVSPRSKVPSAARFGGHCVSPINSSWCISGQIVDFIELVEFARSPNVEQINARRYMGRGVLVYSAVPLSPLPRLQYRRLTRSEVLSEGFSIAPAHEFLGPCPADRAFQSSPKYGSEGQFKDDYRFNMLQYEHEVMIGHPPARTGIHTLRYDPLNFFVRSRLPTWHPLNPVELYQAQIVFSSYRTR